MKQPIRNHHVSALNNNGNDDVWVGNFWGRGVVLMAGDQTKGHPAGTKTGDAIHVFEGGSISTVLRWCSLRTSVAGPAAPDTCAIRSSVSWD